MKIALNLLSLFLISIFLLNCGDDKGSGSTGDSNCSAACQDENAVKCMGKVLFKCKKSEACLRWEQDQSCTENQVCSEEKKLCTHAGECKLQEDSFNCVSGKVQRFDGCGFEKGKPNTCQAKSSCQNGECQGEGACSGICKSFDVKCSDDYLMFCQKDENSGCFKWSEKFYCGDKYHCAEGQCRFGCKDRCKFGTLRCDGEQKIQSCQRKGECTDWAELKSCEGNKVCKAGDCVEPKKNCKDDCLKEGVKACLENSVKICKKKGECFAWEKVLDCKSPAVCSGDSCKCPTGQVPVDGKCKSTGGGTEPSSRTQKEVCARYKNDFLFPASAWKQGADQCDPGTLDQKAVDDAVKVTNFYRWMVGLKPVKDDPTLNKGAQACSIIQAKNGALSHYPPKTSTCWNQLGYDYSSKSNLGKGYRSAAAAIQGYVIDKNVPSLGHRRWIFSPKLGKTGIGYVTSGRGTCQHVFDRSQPQSIVYIAYPSPGPFPYAMWKGAVWSVQNWSPLKAGSGIKVSITRKSDSKVDTPQVTKLKSGYAFGDAISFRPSNLFIKTGESYQVTVEASGQTIKYTINFVDCP